MAWAGSAYLRRGAVANTGATLGASSSLTDCGFVADTGSCWYEVSYGTDSGLAIVTAHYRFVVGAAKSSWPSAYPGEYRVNVPVTPANLSTYRPVGTWHCTTWWGWGASGIVELYQTDQQLKLLRRNHNGAISIVGHTTVSAIANQTETEWYLNVRYEAA